MATVVNRFQSWYRTQPKALRAVLTINVVLYVLWVLLLAHIGMVQAFVWEHLALNPSLPGLLFEPWQLVTYNFLHLGGGLNGFLHVLFNMLWLVWIGREYEELHGPHSFLALYLLTGVGGGLVTVLAYNTLFSGNVVVYGASASVLGVMMAVAIRYPYKSIALFLIGTIRLIWVVAAFFVLDLLFIRSSSTAIAAHVGGALFGFLFAKAEGNGVDLSSWARIFFRDRRRSRRPSAASARPPERGVLNRLESWLAARNQGKGKEKREKKPSNVHPLRSTIAVEEKPGPSDEVEREVDRILDKISAHGYDALTDEEKRVLYDASRRQ